MSINGTIIPETVGPYRIVRMLGKGTFAVVALGEHEKTKQLAALKMINRKKMHEMDMLQYIDAELRLSMRFNHPSIVKVFDILYLEDLIVIVMEYLPNNNVFNNLCKGVYFNFEEKCEIIYRICEGINYLHERKIAHRDIKPENILFDAKFQPKLIDFGLANGS